MSCWRGPWLSRRPADLLSVLLDQIIRHSFSPSCPKNKNTCEERSENLFHSTFKLVFFLIFITKVAFKYFSKFIVYTFYIDNWYIYPCKIIKEVHNDNQYSVSVTTLHVVVKPVSRLEWVFPEFCPPHCPPTSPPPPGRCAGPGWCQTCWCWWCSWKESRWVCILIMPRS